jgi:hypothetical protein
MGRSRQAAVREVDVVKGSRVFVLAGLTLALFTAPAQAATNAKPVPSLQPAATAKLWTKLIHQRHAFAAQATADCRPARTVFYSPTDWLRLATKLAASGSPCAQYYISIPPLAADKTAFRTDQAWRIRALGPNFHALAEFNVSGWTTWVTSNGGNWYAAGVEARRRMAAAGYDVRLGDSWVVNEFSSAVRRGDGTARQDMRNLVHGLYDGDPSSGLPQVKGGVFIGGIAQSTADLSVYKTNLENWFQDGAFWTDMDAYVSDWSQELYGDVRNYAVAGTSPQDRAASLDDYLEHVLTHANAGPDSIAAARSFLQATDSPLANAAWRYQSAFGWTDVDYTQMEDYVSAQTYALRSFQAKSGHAQDHFGFVWSLNNLDDLDPSEFANETGAIADRLAAAIRDSGKTVDPSDPGIGACLPNWCSTVVSGAAFATQWKSFQTWPQPALAFSSAPVAVTAGSPSAPISVQLPSATSAPVTITLTSSSSQGSFAASVTTPWSGSNPFSLTVPAGQTTASVYYEDTRAGNPTLTASASGYTSVSQVETVTAAVLASISIAPSSATVATGGSQTFSASGADAYGNPVGVSNATWSVSPAALGTVSPATGGSTTFTAGASAGSGSLFASVGAVQGSASLSVIAASVPGSPANLVAVPASGKGVQLSWTAPSNTGGSAITSYRIYRSTTGQSGSFVPVAAIGGTTTTYKDTSTARGATYYYYVTAVNSAGESVPSNTAAVKAK